MHDIFVLENNVYDIAFYQTSISDDIIDNKKKLIDWLNATLIGKEFLATNNTDYATVTVDSVDKIICDLSDSFQKELKGLFTGEIYKRILLFGNEEGSYYSLSNSVPKRIS
ncbi:hypothetical protein [Levilactobacillus phage ENFP1]|nr:hypothetical protein [Levilactobacillus phage ENFP1]